MAKTKISEFSATPANNTDIDSINIAEGCAPSGINDAIRELMSQLKDWQSGTSNDPMVIGSTGSLTLSYGTANGVPYLNGSKVLTSGSALTFDGSTLGVLTSNAVPFQVSSSNASATLVQHTNSNASADLFYRFRQNAGAGNWYDLTMEGSTNAFTIDYNDNERFRINSAGNVGIGTSSPATKLDVVGSARVSGVSGTGYQGLRLFGTGTAYNYMQIDNTGGVINFGLENSTGGSLVTGTSPYATVLSSYSNTPIQFGTNNTLRMTLDSSGNLGIGTSSPGMKLDVTGAGRFNSSGEALTVGSSALAANTAQYFRNTSGYGVLALTSAADQYLSGVVAGDLVIASNGKSLRFGNAGSGTLGATLDSSGNLGLGVTPSAWGSPFLGAFEGKAGTALVGRSDAAQSFLFNNAFFNGSNYRYKANGFANFVLLDGFSGGMGFNIAPSGTAGNAISFTQAMTLDASGNLGVGITSPAGKLDVRGNSAATYVIDTTSGSAVSSALYLGVPGATTYAGLVTDYANDRLNFRHNSATRMTLDSSGNLLVGATSTSAGAKLYVKGSGASNAAARLYNPDLTDSNFTLYVDKPSATTTTSQVFIGFTINAQGTGSGQINANGASQAAFGSFSDARLKENIVGLEPQLEKVMALRPVEFDYKDGSGHQTGFVAQEMQQVYPDAIGEQKGFLTVSGYGKTEARLIKAIQELKAIVDAQGAEIAALKAAA